MPRVGAGGCSLPGCAARATHRGMCHEHYLAYERQRGTATERGYGVAWRRIRDAHLEAHPACAMCGGPATMVDHVTARRKGGSDHPANLQSLCHPCHNRKTIASDGGLGR